MEEKFWKKIKEYIEDDSEEDEGANEIDEENDQTLNNEEYDESMDYSQTGLALLLEIIKLIHNKSSKNTGLQNLLI